MTRHTSLELAAKMENIPRFRGYVETACAREGLGAEHSFALKLAVDEACTNIIEHGYDDEAAGTIQLVFETSDGEARVTIIDTGRSFPPEDAPHPDVDADWKDRPIGGLGWHLIRSVMDEIRYRTDGAENRLTLVRKIGAESEPQDHEENDDGNQG